MLCFFIFLYVLMLFCMLISCLVYLFQLTSVPFVRESYRRCENPKFFPLMRLQRRRNWLHLRFLSPRNKRPATTNLAMAPSSLESERLVRLYQTAIHQTHSKRFISFRFSAFGLGTMIYNGLEFGVFFEIPLDSPCHQILRGVNPLLQLVFTFMQMYFIFMNARVRLKNQQFVYEFTASILLLYSSTFTNLNSWLDLDLCTSLRRICVSGSELWFVKAWKKLTNSAWLRDTPEKITWFLVSFYDSFSFR